MATKVPVRRKAALQTRLSTRGQVVLPAIVRRRLALQPGDPLDIDIQDGRVTLTPHTKARKKAKIVIDPVSGLPAVTLGPGAPVLTSKEVKEILADFP
jgi:AbrB family looped-hinge helix DNA binding protein